ncbi:MAG: GHMP kinase [Alphaproteobacteria bacterium]|nr:GHMP kinase [Alphaproteobacteria bacterium]
MINSSPSPNSRPSVHISTSARLHFGFMDLQGGLGRRFGSIGLAIDGIETSFALSLSTDFAVQGAASREDHDRSLAHLRRLSRDYGFPPATMMWQQAIPSHAGLGSGTQLAMAIAESYAVLAGRNLAPSQLAERGARSGIGLAVYHQGGLVVDGGQKYCADKIHANYETPPVLARLDFPEDWRFVLILDETGKGLHNDAERAAFAALPPMSAATSGELCRQVLMQLLPGVIEHDFAAVSQAIGAIQRINGDYFAPAQGGRYAHPVIGRILAQIAKEGDTGGHRGIGQSSWGPTGFVLAPTAAAALEVENHIQQLCRAFSENTQNAVHISTRITKARNCGRRLSLKSE